ncbi:unnamed protein product [Dicrocoelium dendriticum]|nr:unnamed protein product [Dicrocoelium dendriticum]
MLSYCGVASHADLPVNGRSLIGASHNDTRQQLTARAPCVQLTVFRESLNWKNHQFASRLSQDEIFHVKLCKRRGRVLGIKLVGKRHLPGLYVLELVPGCEAELDGRLRKDDQILEINGINLSNGSQEQAAHIINTSADFVNFKVRRRYRSDTPDILRTAGESNEQTDVSIATHVVGHKVFDTPRLGRNRLCSSESMRPRLQRTRSVQSDTERRLVSSFQTETSSLHASQTASSLIEGDIVATSTSPLLNDDEDQETDSGRSPQHFVHPFKDTGPIESKVLRIVGAGFPMHWLRLSANFIVL